MRTIAFFNNKGGVGKTTLVYHIAWMMSELGHQVLAVDLDPQANLSSMFLTEDLLEKFWPDQGNHSSILGAVQPILDGLGDIADPFTCEVRSTLYLIPGDLGLSQFEAKLSDSWPRCLDNDAAAYRVVTAFHRIIALAAQKLGSDIVLIDVGPNLGAINRSALIATRHVISPLAPDLYSLQGLKNLGPTLDEWRTGWQQRLERKPATLNIGPPSGQMVPAGYIIMQHVERKNRPVRAFQKWVQRIPETYHEFMLRESAAPPDPDPCCLGLVRNYQSLMPMAQDARKPIFFLTSADGAIGAHFQSAKKCYQEFRQITQQILDHTDDCEANDQ